ncbi:MAG: CoB--CoM heterodisulfide reductase iron-sulfur subunit A family protein [Deltaproteobacteria bacterium]|nr:CoB--CoM heterodisulfide reductase iron-sulfur subunit A family protein [Deltaproteobacteria bacterium]
MEQVSGEVGAFQVAVRKKARYVNENLCTGCGACAEKCPTMVVDVFNAGLGNRKAIYKYFPQGIPSVFTIDAAACRQLGQGKKCGVCAKVCQAKAVDYDQKDTLIQLEVGAVVIATGYEVFDPSVIPEYGYDRIPNVVTALEFERLLSASGPTAGHLDRPSELALVKEMEEAEKEHKKLQRQVSQLEEKHGKPSSEIVAAFQSGTLPDDADLRNWALLAQDLASLEARLDSMNRRKATASVARKLAFIQCVGSRDFRFNPFCSSYCCMHSVKEAMIAHEHDNGVHSSIFCMDLRAVGRGFEEYKLRGGKQANIRYIRGRVAEITQDEALNPVVWYESTQNRQVVHETFDLVILATACVPSPGAAELARQFQVELDRNGFFKTDPLAPLNTSRPGVFVCGCAQGPMDIPESVAQASSAAARAAEIVAPARQAVG